jgi:hypothetical protein
MVSATIREILDGYETPDIDKPFCIYVVKNGDDIFYVGQSRVGVEYRFLSHLGKGDPRSPYPDHLGNIIIDNMPDSANWTVEFMTMQDCAEYIRKWFPHYHDQTRWDVDNAEQALIHEFEPYCNVMHRRKANPLPKKYNKHPIANDGVILD